MPCRNDDDKIDVIITINTGTNLWMYTKLLNDKFVFFNFTGVRMKKKTKHFFFIISMWNFYLNFFLLFFCNSTKIIYN